MKNELLKNIYSNLVSTAIVIIAIFFVYGLFYLLVIRKIKDERQKQKFRIRSFYVACVIFLFFMERVWVEGFTHLLAVLGLVSAGLVVTNKETIMNFVGWLVITWRGLFSEDDLIQIQQYKGYVKRIGVLYVMLYEVLDSTGNISGRVIRIPNGLVSNNPIINFSQTTHLFEQSFTLSFSSDNDFMALKEQIKTVVDNIIAEVYKGRQEFSVDYLGKRSKQLPSRIRLGARVTLQSKSENLSTMQLITRYYCFSRDAEKIQESILLALLKLTKGDPSIRLG